MLPWRCAALLYGELDFAREKFRPVDWISHVSPKSTAAQLMHLQTEKRLNEVTREDNLLYRNSDPSLLHQSRRIECL